MSAPLIALSIYAVGFFIAFYAMCFSVSRKEAAGEDKEAAIETEIIFPVSFFWPLLAALAIIASPFLLLKWLAEKHSKTL